MHVHALALSALIRLLSGYASNGVSPPPQARWVAEDSQALKVMKAADVDEGLKDVTVDDAVAVSDGRTGLEDTLAAEKRLYRIIEAAVMEALPGGYTGKPFEWTDTASIGLKSHYRQLRIDAPGCADFSCLIRGPFIPEPFSERGYKDHVGPMPTRAFLSTDTERNWAYQRPGRPLIIQKIEDEYREKSNLTAGSWLRQETTDWSAFDKATWLTRLSQALPEWLFFYIGPGAEINQSEGIPMVLNQGDSLLFVKEGDGGDAL